MLKRTASLILTFITLLSLLSIAITPVSATEEMSNTTHENVDDSNWTLDTWSPEFYDSETQEPITSPVLPQQVSEAPITTQPIVTIPPTIVIIKPTSPITSPVIIYPTGVPIVSINTTSVITQPIISTEPSNNTVVIATDPTEEINHPLFTEPAEKLSSTINVSKSSEGKYKVSANATGGSGYYEYQFLVNNTLYQDFSDKNQCTFMLTTNGNYNFKVIVKDSTGNTISTDTTIVVNIDSENTTEHIESTYPSIPIIKPTETKTTIPVSDFSSDPTTTTKAEATTTSVDKGLLGDVTTDGKVNIRDATAIQKHLAKIKLLSDDALLLADFDQNEKLNIKDATTIQKFIAGLIDNGTHTHKYNKTVISPTCTEKGYTLYQCSCGDTNKKDWTNPKHIFHELYCTHCNISSLDYLLNWLYENGNKDDEAECYYYKFDIIQQIDGMENFEFYILTYYDSQKISFYFKDIDQYGIMVNISKELGWENHIIECFCTNTEPLFYMTSAFITDQNVLDSLISVCYYELGSIPSRDAIDYVRVHTYNTIVASELCLKSYDIGVSMLDLGFIGEYNQFNFNIPHDKNHTHSYSKISDTHTQDNLTLKVEYACSCGDRYLENAVHSFKNYACTTCGISPFDYYVNWIKENGNIDINHYEYQYPNLTNLDGLENTIITVAYYPTTEDYNEYIALECYDTNTGIITWVTLDNNETSSYCMCHSDTYFKINTNIDITTFTTNTAIAPVKYEEGSYTYSSALECAQTEIALTILMHDRSMYDAGVGVSVVDLGFYSIYSDDDNPTPPVEDNVNPPVNNNNTYLEPILNCNDFPLHLYSNDGKVYLGKLVTNKYDSDSIWNEYGEYGSKYRTNSIWNEYGTYGSKYNTNSAFNPYASSPPIIVTNSGTKIGYLTANEYKLNGYTITELERLLKSIGQ